MRLLITGGCGFIGSNFIRYLLRTYPQYHLTNLDKLTYAGNLANVQEVAHHPRYRFVQGDICDAALVQTLVKEVDAVINFAAETHVDRSIHHPDNFIQTNMMGTLVLLEAAKRYGVQRYVQISTDEVYGSRDTGGFQEADPLCPSSPYAASKAAGDLLVQSFWTTHQLPVLITRSSNNFGPYQYPEKFIPLCLTNAMEDKPLPLYGDGQNVRDWIHVLDHCLAIDAVLHRGQLGEIYNIGGSNERSNLEIVHSILHTLGKDTTLIRYVPDRPGHDRRYALDCRKIRRLGFTPQQTFEAALAATIQWYGEHEGWWRPIKDGAFREYYQRMYEGQSSSEVPVQRHERVVREEKHCEASV